MVDQCPKCGSNYILTEFEYQYNTKSRVPSPYCQKCGWRPPITPTKEVPVSSSICTIDGCDNQAQKFGLCRRHFKEKHGMTLDTYNAKKVTELAAQEPEADPPYPFANPETGKPMGRCKRVSEVYQYELDALSATVTISEGKLAGIKVRWENGEEWSIKDTDMPFLSGLVKEVEELCRT